MENHDDDNNPALPTISNRIKIRLVECIKVSPVTIVVGPTGCGKSTQVPSFLLDAAGGSNGRILCSQPRRLAAIAIASHVAKQRSVELGGSDVGYHVGQDKRRSSDTKLVFTTAGLFLEELRGRGLAVATDYKVIVLDECHERSPESDLVLALLRSLLRRFPQKQIRIVLMSATFDHGRYRDYFRDVPNCQSIDTITLETVESFKSYYDRVDVNYLEHVRSLLLPNHDEQRADWFRGMRLDPDADLTGGIDRGKSLTDGLLDCVRDLVEALHEKEKGGGGSDNSGGAFLIFAPTYHHLEQIYDRLLDSESSSSFRLGVLHSAVDMDHILRTMKSCTSGLRKVLLASAIADSSITIPGVCCVIDLCRSLSVEWDAVDKKYVPRTAWSSKSVCDQRMGRTGRTCAGSVYRLVPQGFYISRLEKWEVPQLTISSCRNEMLKLLCAGKAAVANPSQLLRECMDPPEGQVIDQALEYLGNLGACVKTKKRIVSTQAGELLAALPFQVEDGLTVIQGARLGLLHEILLWTAIGTQRPPPIVNHFGESYRNEDSMRAYYPKVATDNPDSVNVAHLAAYLTWETAWGSQRSKAALDHFARASGGGRGGEMSTSRIGAHRQFSNEGRGANDGSPCCNVWKWTPELEEEHAAWCEEREINPTSVRCIADLINNAMNVFYHSSFEPEWLRSEDPSPAWKQVQVRHVNEIPGSGNMLPSVYGTKHDHLITALRCLSQAAPEASTHAALFRGDGCACAPKQLILKKRPLACVHFLNGDCKFGSRCRYSHSVYAQRPLCKFFADTGYCLKMATCKYSHRLEAANNDAVQIDKDLLAPIAPVMPALEADAVRWFDNCHDKLLLLGEGDFEFTRSLQSRLMCPQFASSLGFPPFSEMGDTSIYQVDATRVHLHEDIRSLVRLGHVEYFSWNFPHTGAEEDEAGQESLILATFQSLAVLLLDDNNRCEKKKTTGAAAGAAVKNVVEYEFALVLQRDQLSRWNVLQSAARTGWHLSSWGNFDASQYRGYRPKRTDGSLSSSDTAAARFYVFRIMTPGDDN